MTFEQLALIKPLLRALKEEEYLEPTPIQQQAIGPALAHKDLLGCAQTGTGKTAAFALPILQSFARNAAQQRSGSYRPVRALVLTPTRELALQIQESFERYGRYLPLRSCVIFGGVSQQPQTQALARGVDILVATPGRLNDLIGQGHISLRALEIFVLDEADRMLDMGFIHDVRRVIDKLPEKRQTMLFSATMPAEIEKLADSILTDPVKVEVTPPTTTVELISQSVYLTDKASKRHLLQWLLEDPAITSALVFTRTKHGADRVARDLNRKGVAARAIHGDKSQGARQDALNAFKSGQCRVLVATDIAARGIDIEELSHVINYDLPNVPETYVHRIGRTGRAGLSGIAISFCDCGELPYLKDIEKLTRQSIPTAQDNPWPMTVMTPPESVPQTTGGGGKAPAPKAQPAPGGSTKKRRRRRRRSGASSGVLPNPGKIGKAIT